MTVDSTNKGLVLGDEDGEYVAQYHTVMPPMFTEDAPLVHDGRGETVTEALENLVKDIKGE